MSQTIMQTYSGGPLDLLDPWPCDFRILDIAQALGKIARFTGHTMHHASVAQHCVLVSLLLDGTGFEMEGLMHDAHEAYIGDISSPMKAAIGAVCADRCGAEFNPVKILADQIDRQLAVQFGFKYPLPQQVKDADLEALTLEHRQMMAPASGVAWPTDVPTRDYALQWMSPDAATEMFLNRYKRLAMKQAAAS